mmetsp:Transcript_45858/g.146342  ORF Transcript_45858/g.146342 Transcript_45858/m.146342 type:complete len:212 (-) Transcript_45858:53-688(-)
MIDLCAKVPLAALLGQAGALHPEEVDRFWLPTICIPGGEADLAAALKDGTSYYIIKPSGGAQGDGIFLASSQESLQSQLRASEPALQCYVAQRYLDQPLLLAGLKFDLRLYVLITSDGPFRAFLCREGLARFCTAPYRRPGAGGPVPRGREDLRGHLTNFSLNKSAEGFTRRDDPGGGEDGSKRALSVVWGQLAAAGVDTNGVHKTLNPKP